jgi:hypothetical protein
MSADISSLIEQIRAGLDDATPGPWTVYDGCSWRRIGVASPRQDDCAVLAPYRASDGHPDLYASRGNDVYANLEHIANCSPDNIRRLLEHIAELEARTEWQPIETAPFDTLVDLWCIQGYEREATWPVRGSLVGGRHKTKQYGWFGNQSNEGVPQGDAPDLVPVAWRSAIVPTDLVARFLCPEGRAALSEIARPTQEPQHE